MNHNKFILTPLSSILTDISLASQGAGIGIETFPLCDYLMQSVFLKLTGAQEQKMKCIFWELASHDYEYRQTKLRQGLQGEYSSYTDKNKIYQDLVSQVLSLSKHLTFSDILNRTKVLGETKSEIDTIFKGTNLYTWAQKSFAEYDKLIVDIKENHFAVDDKTLFASAQNISPNDRLLSGNGLKEIYEQHLYAQRNRVAHNTLSYQQNLPTLKKLQEDSYIYENYFVYFFLLILIDKIVIQLFEEHIESRNTSIHY